MIALLVLSIGFAPIADWPLTRAERTQYKETSHYSDVIRFVQTLQERGAPVTLSYTGTSTKGSPMPLVICSRPLVHTAAEARRTGKPIIYIQANIHAGEVEGKEAAQMILRDYCKSSNTALDKVILLVNPIYNIDGNEAFGPQERNRPEQDGPALVGLRANGQGLDLNRDGVKVESPEMRAALESIYVPWDPDVMMDLHTTDGTRHGYSLTYAPPLNPNTDPGIMKFSRDAMLPSIRKSLKKQFGMELFDYGDVINKGGKQAWYTVAPDGRYVTNYMGLRNRIGILSEATTYRPFKDRVTSTYRFVDAVVSYVAAHASEVVSLAQKADERMTRLSMAEKPHSFGVRFEFDAGREEDALLERLPSPKPPAGSLSASSPVSNQSSSSTQPANTAKNRAFSAPLKMAQPSGEAPRTSRGGGNAVLQAPIDLVKVKMPIYDRFKVTRTAEFPQAYVVPRSEIRVVNLLLRHGVVVEKVISGSASFGGTFIISQCKVAGQPFQGHKLITLEGKLNPGPVPIESESYLVRTSQPLGMLIFHMLEPECEDGVAAWGYLGESFSIGSEFPIKKVMMLNPLVAVKVTDPLANEIIIPLTDLGPWIGRLE